VYTTWRWPKKGPKHVVLKHNTIIFVVFWLIVIFCIKYYIFQVGVVSLGIQHAMRMRHIVICGLPRSTIFFTHYLINGKIFGKKSYWTQNVCFDLVYIFIWKTKFSFYEESSEIWYKMRESEVLISVVKCSLVKCSEVLQCNDGTSDKVSSIIRRHIDNRKLLLLCILLLLHSLIFFRFLFL